MISVVPGACLTKTLTQPLVVYSFALDNRMCSSIRPQITLCQNQKLCLFPSRPLPRPPPPPLPWWAACVCVTLTILWKDRWRTEGEMSWKRGKRRYTNKKAGERWSQTKWHWKGDFLLENPAASCNEQLTAKFYLFIYFVWVFFLFYQILHKMSNKFLIMS